MAKLNKKDSSPRKLMSKSSFIYSIILFFWSIYLFVIYNTPNDTVIAEFGISERTAVLLRFSIAVPYLLMWLVIAYTAIKLFRYSNIIGKSKQSTAFRHFARGSVVLLSGLIFASIFGAVRSLINSGDFFDLGFNAVPLLTVVVNYSHVIPYIIAFGFFFFGAHSLRVHEKIGFNVRPFILLSVILLGFAYVWLEIIFSNPARQSETMYYLQDSLIVLTIVMPSLVAWFMGATAVSNIRSYQRKIHGIIYKRAFRYFAWGLVGVVCGSILLQALLSLGADRLISLGLEDLLALIYVFLLMQTFGFGYMGLGAKQLTKIETV